ncbi:cryptochrome/photolyase family protein [Frigidibacter mobilis]|uniref:Deoxyribodipyrimidine photolyase, putative n=1 Tax=Frigidibacter mobilis TaxID=1335048 RepID=A0A161GM27_9RHOB|nr:deoxyribodipyrimidine photo-lyase [Frigidibacter mobilis]AMY69273.1 deoxyribodipyrimidine photolyase, putative [Frigidibacter mobilis]
MTDTPLILWIRRDLRLADHPALAEAAATGRPVIPVFVLDEVVEGYGAAPKWRLGEGLAAHARALEGIGSRLILRRGPALPVLRALVAETGAGAVWWQRLYDPAAQARDTAVKAALKAEGVEARSFAGALLFEPWEVETGQGGFYKVYTPFWNAVKGRDPGLPAAPPKALRPPEAWPASDRLQDWALGAGMRRGAEVVAKHACVGEARALARLDAFLGTRVQDYRAARDFPGREATSGLSENLAWGEIGPRSIWQGGMRALHAGAAGAEHFLKELVWREFAAHLMQHSPELASRNWREGWDDFPWRGNSDAAERWRRGMTGEPFVDAAMREMYVTGTMHNRARMIAASYLTKHLMTDWRLGLAWFEDCLIDWDPASNAMGWQWVAGSGPDAAPYFRVFNPAGQADKFDPDRAYRDRWIAEGQARPPQTALDFFAACPEAWGLSPGQRYPAPVISLAEGRARALAAYAGHKS